LSTPKNVFKAEEIIKARPEVIFDVLEDPLSWTVWAFPIQKVEWTSPKPFGIGTTRSVHMMGFANRRVFKKFKEYTQNYAAKLQIDSLGWGVLPGHPSTFFSRV
jgi:hypothetical protein